MDSASAVHVHRHSARSHAHASVVSPAAAAAPLVRQDLTSASGAHWLVSGVDDSGNKVNAHATVPGNVYLDLTAARVLTNGDPLYRDNDQKYDWWVNKKQQWARKDTGHATF